jgi:DNA-binding GntR family transcriptional regulator
MDRLRVLSGSNLREQVVSRVRAEITSGRTPSDKVYTVPGLASELGVSTTPVREALLELSRSGFLVPMRNRGFRVNALTLEALEHLFALRELLERFALESLARKGLQDPAAVRELADAVSHAVECGDIAAYVVADNAFHKELVAQAGNPFLTLLVQQLREHMCLYGLDSEEGERLQKASIQENHQMVELAIRQDVAALGELISRHINAWKPLFRSALANAT